MFTPKLLLYKGTGIIGRLIRWQSRGDYGHTALWLAEDEVIESSLGHGVRRRAPDDLEKADVFDVRGMTPESWALVALFARCQLGKPYDLSGVLRFISRRPESVLRWTDSWFCSEFAFAALQAGGVNLLERIPPWKVSPTQLSTSPLLETVTLRSGSHALDDNEDPRVGLFSYVHSLAA